SSLLVSFLSICLLCAYMMPYEITSLSLHDALPILDEVKVVANIAQDRKTPVAVSTIDKREIVEELGSQDLPMVSLENLILQLFLDRKSTRLNSSHVKISYAVFCLKKKIISTATYTS